MQVIQEPERKTRDIATSHSQTDDTLSEAIPNLTFAKRDYQVEFRVIQEPGRRDVALPRLTLKPMTLFRKRFRIESARKPYWDYAAPGCYLVTICTENRKPFFGRVINDAVDLSAIGVQVSKCWREIPQHHKNVELDEFIVMPNHVHGIVVLTGRERPLPPLRRRGDIKRIRELFSVHPEPGSLAAVIGSFKSAVSYWSGKHPLQFDWQPRFHDRIIRGKNSLKAVREYIRANPANWRKDEFFVP